jgi:hypothetical protein
MTEGDAGVANLPMPDAATAWAELARERVVAVLRLQRLNRQAQQMLAGLIDPRGHIAMPVAFSHRPAGVFLLGTGIARSGDACEFIEAVIAAGIMTAGEVAKISEAKE